MKDIYKVAGISKQAIWSYNRRKEANHQMSRQLVDVMNDFRKHHKEMGCRAMYYTPGQIHPVGRDKFEQIGFANGFKLKQKRNAQKTTWAQRVEVYPNLIEGITINNINQVWQSDIFYLSVEGQHYYGVTIEDIYSRVLLSLHLSTSQSARETEIALKKAIKFRKGHNLSGCIFHSDRGGQYFSNAHKILLKSYEMKISMCKMPQQNAYVERIQGTLKNQYLYPQQPTVKNIFAIARKSIHYYNEERPHRSLSMKTPAAYEQEIQQLDEKQRPKMQIYQASSKLSTKHERY